MMILALPEMRNLMRERYSPETINTLTTTAVLAHENELCSRNMVCRHTHAAARVVEAAEERRRTAFSDFCALENSDQDGKGDDANSESLVGLQHRKSLSSSPRGSDVPHCLTRPFYSALMNGMHAMKSTGTSAHGIHHV
jgi:hypothetical protein